MRTSLLTTTATLAATLLLGCGGDPEPGDDVPASRPSTGTPVAVTDTVITDVLEAPGTAEPFRSATLSTRLMATVTEVMVHEGDRVAEGAALVRLDSRDLEARHDRIAAELAAATAARTDAAAQAGRIRGLYADSAATRAQLDAVEAGLARAEAGVRMAEAAASELQATATYAVVRAPFAGTVTNRFVDPGAFASPGAPLIAVEDAGTLRVVVSVGPEAARDLRRGATIEATVGDTTVTARVEGVVPSGANRYLVNALVANPDGRLPSGSAASLAIPRGKRAAILIPVAAVIHRDDLTGVEALVDGTPSLRWVRLGRPVGDAVEVLSELAAGDTVLVGTGGH